MGIKATPLDGWTEFTPTLPWGNEGSDAVRCECRPLMPEVEALVVHAVGKLDLELQRQVIMSSCRKVQNYEGTNGQPITNGAEIINYGGKQASKVIFAIVSHIVALSLTKADQGK